MLTLRSAALCFLLPACGGTISTAPTDTGSATGGSDSGNSSGPASEIDYRDAGPYSVQSANQSFNVGNDCTLDSTVYEPQNASEAATVILSHGFARSKANMVAWGEHLASWGLTVITPDLCHASPFDSNHEQNGVDLQGLSAQLGASKVIFAGHSAGGLASVLAGTGESKTVAVIGLDLTDAADAAVKAAANLQVPFFGIAGEPGSCNSNGNGTAVVAQGSNFYGLRTVDADHCDFEGPTDGLCTAFCANGSAGFSDEEIQDAIRGLFTSAAMGSAGLDSYTTDQWWTTGGVFFEELNNAGSILPL